MPALWRKLKTSFWRETTDEELSAEDKLLYAYFMTNDLTTVCGIYSVSKKTMLHETGLSEAGLESALQSLTEKNKIIYHEPTREVFLLNHHKHLPPKSWSLQVAVRRELLEVKHQDLVELRQHIIDGFEYRHEPEPPPEEAEVAKEDPIPYDKIIKYLNKRTGRNYQVTNKLACKAIKARFADGFTPEDFKAVIDFKVKELKGTQRETYLRPETLFGEKMDGYRQAVQPVRSGPTVIRACPVCGYDMTGVNAPACVKCSFMVEDFADQDKVDAHTEVLRKSGLLARLGIA